MTDTHDDRSSASLALLIWPILGLLLLGGLLLMFRGGGSAVWDNADNSPAQARSPDTIAARDNLRRVKLQTWVLLLMPRVQPLSTNSP